VSSAGKPLARGSSGNEVLRLQLRLRELGFDPGPADGLFGPKTERALIAFQKANMLDQTGVADANSRQMLGV
jgi:peptidoglycan hydrolase-like protein with peptidoglycan-binding domain